MYIRKDNMRIISFGHSDTPYHNFISFPCAAAVRALRALHVRVCVRLYVRCATHIVPRHPTASPLCRLSHATPPPTVCPTSSALRCAARPVPRRPALSRATPPCCAPRQQVRGRMRCC